MIGIGIDLGTTYSVVCHVGRDGSVDVIPNDVGSPLTASAVHFGRDGTVTVGAAARDRAAVDPDRTSVAIKRQMGRDHALLLGGHAHRPESISAIILRSLVGSACEHLAVTPDEIAAVISVPAYFGVAEREATAAAAQIAGLTCLDLVAEPVAAALAYGIASGRTGTALVYDLGGGTFDATVVELTPTGPRVAAVDGSAELGGLDFDERLADLLMARYLLATSDEQAADDEDFVGRLAGRAESVKRALTRTESSAVVIDRLGHTVRITVTRAEFEAACIDLLDETMTVADRAVAAARATGTAAPEQVVLVGGSTRMPMVSAALTEHLHLPIRLGEPDLAVAKGAAIQAHSLVRRPVRTLASAASGTSAPPAERLLSSRPVHSVVPRALGIKIIDSHDPSGDRTIVQYLIPANQPLPVSPVEARFATIMPNQERVRVELMEQAGAVAATAAEFNRRVLDGEIINIPKGLKAGSPIEISLAVGLDGRIRCTATEPKSGRELVLESYVDGVSDSAEMETHRAAVSALKLER